MENMDISQLKVIKELFPEDVFKDIYKQMTSKQEEAEKALKEPVKIIWEGKEYNLKVTGTVTGKLRQDIRRLSFNMPQSDIEKAIKEVNSKYPDKADVELREQIYSDYPDITPERLEAYLANGKRDFEHEAAIDIFYLKYYQLIIDRDGTYDKLRQQLESDIDEDNEFWMTAFDITEVRRVVRSFRNVHAV